MKKVVLLVFQRVALMAEKKELKRVVSLVFQRVVLMAEKMELKKVVLMAASLEYQ